MLQEPVGSVQLLNRKPDVAVVEIPKQLAKLYCPGWAAQQPVRNRAARIQLAVRESVANPLCGLTAKTHVCRLRKIDMHLQQETATKPGVVATGVVVTLPAYDFECLLHGRSHRHRAALHAYEGSNLAAIDAHGLPCLINFVNALSAALGVHAGCCASVRYVLRFVIRELNVRLARSEPLPHLLCGEAIASVRLSALWNSEGIFASPHRRCGSSSLRASRTFSSRTTTQRT